MWQTRSTPPVAEEIRSGYRFWLAKVTPSQWGVWLLKESNGQIDIYYPMDMHFMSLKDTRDIREWRCCTVDALPMDLPVWIDLDGRESTESHPGDSSWAVKPLVIKGL